VTCCRSSWPFLLWLARRLPATPTNDFAFVVPEEVSAHDLAAVIRRAGAPLLTALELFDLYRGEPLPKGAKSLAFRLTFQSQDATLGGAEVGAVRGRIEQAVAETLGGKLRA
jgi:phenylalanyl-tRNA synthetase beta chain